MEIIGLLGKLFIAALFIDAGVSHFRFKDANVAYTRSKKIPLPELAVVLSGLVLIIAPLMLILNKFVVVALTMLSLFLVTTCVFFHQYWKEMDTQSKNIEKQAFYKNLALLGSLLTIMSLI